MAATIVSSSRLTCQSYLRFILSQCNRRQLSTKACRQKHHSRLTSVTTYCGCCSVSLSTQGHYVNVQATSLRLSTFRNFHIGQSLYDVKVLKTPGFPESVSEGDIRWEKGVGDAVAEDEVVGEIETDKTAIEVRAPVAGVLSELLVPDGEKVVAGQDIYKLTIGEGVPAASSAPPPAPPLTEQAPPPEQATPPPPPIQSPTAAAIPTTPPPVPPIPTQPMSSKPVSQVPVTPAKPATPASSGFGAQSARTETRTKMNRMRLRIAQRMMDAKDTYAMLTSFNEIDMTNVMEMRTKYKETFMKKYGLKLGFMSAFLKASAYALQEQPVVNAVIDDQEILYRDYIDISVAVATPKGLVVPVLRDVGAMNFADIERGLLELGEKARGGNLAIEDMDGGTFTVSNGGVFGSLMGTPIINPPQSAILGMHGIFDRPVAVQGKVEVRPMMYVALTYDHRLIDGREAVTFLRKIKSAVEDPRSILLAL